MKRFRIIVSPPHDNAYQHVKGAVVKSTAKHLNVDLHDPTTQSQRLLQIVDQNAVS